MVCSTIFYPGRTISNLFFDLDLLDLPALVSPLHDQDKNPEGDDKEPHYHVLIVFDDSMTFDLCRKVIDSINGVGCESVQSVRGYARYMCHLDNPRKAQYSADDVRCFGGMSYDKFL